jgi:hypothetical protein
MEFGSQKLPKTGVAARFELHPNCFCGLNCLQGVRSSKVVKNHSEHQRGSGFSIPKPYLIPP